MGFQIKLGASAWDAVAYVRNAIEDIDPNNVIVPDSAFQSYAEDVLEDFERWVPITYQLGNTYAPSSPMTTVSGQQRYLCNAANGFIDGQGNALTPTRFLEVLYRASAAYSAASELTYLTILPFSPISAFLLEPDLLEQPTQRYLRDKAFNELDHYGRGFVEVVLDGSGYYALDLYPTPTTSGLPIFARYNVLYPTAQDTGKNLLVATIPEKHKRRFAKLLLALVKEQEAERLAKAWDAKVGIMQERANPMQIKKDAEDLRQSVYRELGSTTPAAAVSS